MKKVFTVLLVLIMSISMAACGSNSVSSTDGNNTGGEPLDLTGLWVQDGKADNETRMVATILEDGFIGVFFVFDDDPDPWTYWVGTYEAPSGNQDKFTWTSENTYGGNGWLSSSDSTKDFSYKNGKITYKVTIDGDSIMVDLIRGNWDTSNIPTDAFNSVNIANADIKELQIKNTSWYVTKSGYLMYYIVLHNPNKDIAIEYPSFRITARDENNVLLGSEDQTLSMIYPGEDFHFGSQAFSVDEIPATVNFEALPPEEYNLTHVNSLNAYKQLGVVNTAIRDNRIVGEIKNDNDYDLDTALILIVCKDVSGNITYIDHTYVDDVFANRSTPFSMSFYGNVDTSNVEFYANQW